MCRISILVCLCFYSTIGRETFHMCRISILVRRILIHMGGLLMVQREHFIQLRFDQKISILVLSLLSRTILKILNGHHQENAVHSLVRKQCQPLLENLFRPIITTMPHSFLVWARPCSDK